MKKKTPPLDSQALPPEVRPGQSVELLKQLHILTRDGKLNADSRRKLKQVLHLTQALRPSLEGLLAEEGEPLLAELSIIRNARLGGWYEFVRGPKPRLHDSVFAYALGQFWERIGSPTTLSVEQICFAPGSPGRVFKLDEDSIVTRLMRLAALTNEAWQWVDTAGLRQIQRFETFDPMTILSDAFGSSASQRQAA